MQGRNPVADTVVLKAPEKEEIVPMIYYQDVEATSVE